MQAESGGFLRTNHAWVYGNTGGTRFGGYRADGMYFERFASVEVQDSIIEDHTAGIGIAMMNYGDKTYFTSCSIRNNLVGLYTNLADPVVENCNFSNQKAAQGRYAIIALNVMNVWGEIWAENNWWAPASPNPAVPQSYGPFHSTENPSGTGDRVSDNVDFEPWSTSPH